MAEISTKPYLIRAIYEWCCDNGYTPHLVVKAGGRARVPMAYVRNGEIVLNVSPTATNGLQMGNEVIEFQARFNGVPEYIVVPVDNVLAIFARETGFVVPFNLGPDAQADHAGPGPLAGGAGDASPARPAEAGAAPGGSGQAGGAQRQGAEAAAPAPSGGADVVDFRAARAVRPGLKSVPTPGAAGSGAPSRPRADDSSATPASEGSADAATQEATAAQHEGSDPGADESGSAARSRRKPVSRTGSTRRKTTARPDEETADATPAASKPRSRSRKPSADADAGSSRTDAAPASAEDGSAGAGHADQPSAADPAKRSSGAPASAPQLPPEDPPPTPPAGGRPRLVRIK